MKTFGKYKKKSSALPIIISILVVISLLICIYFVFFHKGNEKGKAPNDGFILTHPEISAIPSKLDNPFFPLRIYPVLDSKYSVIYDRNEEFYLYEKNADEKCYPASLTKLMTAAVALETVDPDTVFTVGDELSLVGYNSSIAWLARGQRLSLKGLISAMILPSGNDAAYVIAAGVGRELLDDPDASPEDAVNAFCGKMNQRLMEISAFNTHFVTPDGYHHDDHYTTARDMLTVTEFALGFDIIRDVCSRHKSRVLFASGEDVTYTNTNLLLNKSSSYYCEHAMGMKTGTTSKAGNCLISLFEKNGREIICVNMGAPDSVGRYLDALNVYEQIFALS